MCYPVRPPLTRKSVNGPRDGSTPHNLRGLQSQAGLGNGKAACVLACLMLGNILPVHKKTCFLSVFGNRRNCQIMETPKSSGSNKEQKTRVFSFSGNHPNLGGRSG